MAVGSIVGLGLHGVQKRGRVCSIKANGVYSTNIGAHFGSPCNKYHSIVGFWGPLFMETPKWQSC